MSRATPTEVQLRRAGTEMRGPLFVACLALVAQGLFFFRNEDYCEVVPLLAVEIAAIGPLLFFAARTLSTKWAALYLSQIGLAYGGSAFVIDDWSVWGVNILVSDGDLLSSLAVAAVGVGACGLGSLWHTTRIHGHETIPVCPLWGSWRWWLTSYVATIWIDHFWAFFSAIGFIGILIRGWPLVAILALDVLARTGRAPAGMTRLIWGGLVPLRMLLSLGTGFGAFIFNEGIVLLFYLTMQRVIRIKMWGIGLACLATFLSFWARTIIRDEIWTMPNGPSARVEVAVVTLQLLAHQLSMIGIGDMLDAFTKGRIGGAVLLPHTVVVNDTPERVPYLRGESFQQLLWFFVPRVVYPDKPLEDWGQRFGHLYGLLHPGDYSTSFNFPQLTEFYANGGIWLVLVMMGWLGWLVCRVGAWTDQLDRRSADVLWVFLPIAFGTLNQSFSNLSLCLNGVIYYAVVLVAPALLHRNVSRHASGRVCRFTVVSASAPHQEGG